MVQNNKPTLEQALINTYINSKASGKNTFDAMSETLNTLTDFLKTSKYTIKTTRNKPTLKIKNKQYSKPITVTYNRSIKGTKADTYTKYIEDIAITPENQSQEMEISTKFILPTSKIYHVLTDMKGELILTLTPKNPQVPLQKREYDFKSVEYTAFGGFLRVKYP